MLHFNTARYAVGENVMRSKDVNEKLKANYRVPIQPNRNDNELGTTNYARKPYDLIFGGPPTIKTTPQLLDEYGEELEINDRPLLLDVTNTYNKEVSGYMMRPELIQKQHLTGTVKLSIIGSV